MFSRFCCVVLCLSLVACAKEPAASPAAKTQSPAAPATAPPPESSTQASAPEKKAETPEAPVAKAEEAPATPKTEVVVTPEQTAPTAEAPATTEAPPASETAAATPAAAEPLSTTVTLGDPSLTMGIPGEGALTLEQIDAWLATPGINDTLEVSLPFGLSLAEAQITGLDENPMTRAKIELGRQLYFDSRLSADISISCASCHSHTEGFAAHTQFGVGIKGQTGNRNSPVSYNRILSGPQFWDGRAATLEEQAIGPIANPIEMGHTHDACMECVKGVPGYEKQFTAVFGPDSMTIGNVAKAIASFERAIVTGPAPYDYANALKPFRDNYPEEEDLKALEEDDPDLYARYLDLKAKSDAHPMSESAARGMELFFSEKSNCTACHAGANFTDEKYHNLGVGMDVEKPDLGRFEISKDEKDKGAFKTPTLRNVDLTGPYMHDGSQKTLEEVVEWYAKGGHSNPWLSDKVKKLDLTDQDKADLVAFMRALTGDFPQVNSARLPE